VSRMRLLRRGEEVSSVMALAVQRSRRGGRGVGNIRVAHAFAAPWRRKCRRASRWPCSEAGVAAAAWVTSVSRMRLLRCGRSKVFEAVRSALAGFAAAHSVSRAVRTTASSEAWFGAAWKR
jgi:hypothetical protein